MSVAENKNELKKTLKHSRMPATKFKTIIKLNFK